MCALNIHAHLELGLEEGRIGSAYLEDIHDTRNSPSSYTFVLVCQQIRIGEVMRKSGEGARVDLVQIKVAQLGCELLQSCQEVRDRDRFASTPCQSVTKVQAGDIIALLFLRISS